MAKKRAAQALATSCGTAGLKLLPALLEDFAVGDVDDLLQKIHDPPSWWSPATTPSRRNWKPPTRTCWTKKLATPEGMALVKAKIAEIEKPTAPAGSAPASGSALPRLRPSCKPLQG